MVKHLQRYDIESGELNIDVLTNNVAICYSHYTYMIVDNNENVMEGPATQTWVFNKENGKWLIRHIHISEPK